MSDVELPLEDYRLLIHFDVSGSRLPVDDVAVTLGSANKILRGVEAAFVEYEDPKNKPVIYVTQVNQGSLGLVLVVVSAGASAITTGLVGSALGGIVGGVAGGITGGIGGVVGGVSILETKHFKEFWKGLTGEEYDPVRSCRSLGKVVRGILSKTVDQIREVTPENISLDGCLKAKSEFFKMLERNKDIKAIGFDKSSKFPINRDQFGLHISLPQTQSLPSIEVYKSVIIAQAVVVDNENKWRFIDKETNKTIVASMNDEEFKTDFLSHSKYPLKQTANDDEIFALFEVDVVEKDGVLQDKEWHVREVYAFNRKALEGKEEIWSKLQASDQKRRGVATERETFRQQLSEEEFPALADLASMICSKDTFQRSLFEEYNLYAAYGFTFEISANGISSACFQVTKQHQSGVYSIETGNFVRGDILKMEDQVSIQVWYRKNCRLLVEEWNNRRPSDCPVGPIDPDICGAS